MVKIAAIGSNEFVVGFQLAGIRDVMEISDKPYDDLKNLRSQKEMGIVIIEDKVIEALEQHQRTEIEASLDPVFIPLSTKIEQDSLKRLIKKSIGVDLWK